MKLKNPIVFGAGQRMSFGDDGILGLSFKRADEIGTSIFQEAVKEGLMDKPIFTTFLSKCNSAHCTNGGLITFGDLDTQNCGEVEAWSHVVPGDSYKFYHNFDFRFDSLDFSYGRVKS
jgi:hypothetical protein